MIDMLLSAILVSAAVAGLPRFLKLRKFAPQTEVHQQWTQLELKSLQALLIGAGIVFVFQVIVVIVVSSVLAATRDQSKALSIGFIAGMVNVVVLISVLTYAASCGSKAKKLLKGSEPPVKLNAMERAVRMLLFIASWVIYFLGLNIIM
jgi:hypothetical protein